MSQVFFTSDTHLSHKLVAGIRGFTSVEGHDECIVRRWNSVVGKRDTVWHLGDVGIGSLSRFAHNLERLNGRKHLITGNHDACAPGVNRKSHTEQRKWLEHFDSIQQYQRFKYKGLEIMASHYPYEGEGERNLPERYGEYRLQDRGFWLIHGHTHSYDVWRSSRPQELHVGWDAWGQPVDLNTILDIFHNAL